MHELMKRAAVFLCQWQQYGKERSTKMNNTGIGAVVIVECMAVQSVEKYRFFKRCLAITANNGIIS